MDSAHIVDSLSNIEDILVAISTTVELLSQHGLLYPIEVDLLLSSSKGPQLGHPKLEFPVEQHRQA